jgi:3-deoxy-D-manno-octulosonic-acid transferase
MRLVHDAAELAQALQALFDDPRQRVQMTAAAQRLLENGRGASTRMLALIEPLLPVTPTLRT